jgi:DNA-binding transcriptional regulator YiaG
MTEFFAATDHEAVELTADRIRELRHRAGLTQVELANAVGVSEDTVRGWENNRSHPGNAETAIRLVRVLAPEPEMRGETQLLPPRYVELSDDRSLAVRKQKGEPPRVFFTKAIPVLSEP